MDDESVDLNWLPGLVIQTESDDDQYFDRLYGYFHDDFIASKPFFRRQRIGLAYDSKPAKNGLNPAFWHIISDDLEKKGEEHRTPNKERCKRIRWPRPIIEAYESGDVRCWESDSRGEPRILLSTADFSFLVVLGQREGFVVLVTAIYKEFPRQRKSCENEWRSYQEAAKNADVALAR